MKLFYHNNIYKTKDINSAKAVILTTESDGGTTQERWDRETIYMIELIKKAFPNVSPDDVFLDFGCGVGRMSKALIQAFGCRVIGVDLSYEMRALAQEYVMDERFSSISYDTFIALSKKNSIKFDYGISIYVLQHCLDLEHDIEAISRVVSNVMVINLRHRAIPVVDEMNRFQYANDGKDIQDVLKNHFTEQSEMALCPKSISVANLHFCKIYSKK